MIKVVAVIERFSVALSSEFGFRFASRLFGEEVIAALPAFTASKAVGKPCGWINWEKATTRGWHGVYGRMVDPGLLWAHISVQRFGNKSTAIPGFWLGRVQPLSGGREYLGEDGRARFAVVQAARRADPEDNLAAGAIVDPVAAARKSRKRAYCPPAY